MACPHVRVKFCGITTPEDALLAVEAGADAIGLNFYRLSPRYIDEEQARAILAVLPPFVEAVGLFVNEPLPLVQGAARRLGLRTLQLHGDHREPVPDDGCSYLPAFPVRDETSLSQLDRYLNDCARLPAAVLVDAHVPGAYGGTGQQAPWEVLARYRRRVPLILAGGLSPDNVGAAIRSVRPYAVDVASGIESTPGRKDPVRMRAFVDAVRSALQAEA